MYADDTMIRTEFMEELLVKLQTEITDEDEGPVGDDWVDRDFDLLKESGKDPFGVCQTGSNAIFCDGCLLCIHKKHSDI